MPELWSPPACPNQPSTRWCPMKKILASILLVSLLSFTASARVAVYKMKVISTKTGGGKVLRATTEGFLIFDPHALTLTTITVAASVDLFSTFTVDTHPEGYRINTIHGEGKVWTVIAINVAGIGATTAKGVNTALSVGDGTAYLPKTFKFSTSDSSTQVGFGVVSYLVEEKGAMVFDQTSTQAANGLGYSVDQTVESIRQGLLAKGYQEQAKE